MPPKTDSICVLGINLSTSMIPKKGIDLCEIKDNEIKVKLAVFDTQDENGNKTKTGYGYLSPAELKNAILLFKQYDIRHENPAYEFAKNKGETEDLGKRYLEKDNFIDRAEAEKMRDYLNQRYEELSKSYEEADLNGIYGDVSASGDVKELASVLKKTMLKELVRETAQQSKHKNDSIMTRFKNMIKKWME